MKKKLLMFLMLVLSIILLAACGGENDVEKTETGDTEKVSVVKENDNTYVFKLGHETQETHVKHMTAENFKEELEARSNGRMTVDIFPAAQLGKEKDMAQQLETGTLDFAFLSNGYMSSRSESMNGWFMPFLFNNLEEAAEARKSDAAKKMLEELESQDLIGFDVFFAGGRHILLKSGIVNSVDDLKGKKLRIPGSPVFEDFWKKVGAGPTPMPLPEVYTALQTGVIDGIDVDLDALLSQKYYEISESLTLSNHIVFPEVALGSKAVFNELSAEDQKIVTEAMEAAVEWGVQKGIELENERVKEVEETGIKVNKLSNNDELKVVAEEIHKEYAAKNPIIKSFIEENEQ